jgi:DinB family protein
MSVFTNSASRSKEEAHAYTAAILGLLGSRDPLVVLRDTPNAIREAVAGMSEAQLSQCEAPGKWSTRHVMQHLADSELVWGYRLRLVLAQDRPPLTGYDQDQWADRLGYGSAGIADALDEFTVLRRANLRLLAAANEADLARVGVHSERGEESVAHMIRMYAGHDLLHLAQLARIRSAVHA